MDFLRSLIKYSTTSTVYAEQSISNPDNSRALYYIACILQAELFDDLMSAHDSPGQLYPELIIKTSLPPHLGGIQTRIPDDVMERETSEDFELRVQLEAGTVPTVDTILRFMTWVQQSTSYSVHCNILGFIYLKRMRAARVILTMDNWRGMWLGSIILAQKVWDDTALRTSSFASVLPGVTKIQLKALELKVFTLLNFSTHVKPSLYARAYYDIRTIFKTILTEYEGGVAWRRPLSVKRAKRLFGGADYENSTAGDNSPRKDLKPLLLPALKGAAARNYSEHSTPTPAAATAGARMGAIGGGIRAFVDSSDGANGMSNISLSPLSPCTDSSSVVPHGGRLSPLTHNSHSHSQSHNLGHYHHQSQGQGQQTHGHTHSQGHSHNYSMSHSQSYTLGGAAADASPASRHNNNNSMSSSQSSLKLPALLANSCSISMSSADSSPNGTSNIGNSSTGGNIVKPHSESPKPVYSDSYMSDIASSCSDSGDSYTLPVLVPSKSKRRSGKGKSSKTYEDFTYTKKSPLYVLS